MRKPNSANPFVRFLALCLLAASFPCAPSLLDAQEPAKAGAPRKMPPGVYLLVDDYYFARHEGVRRAVVQPQRHLAEPVVTTAARHQNWQPFFTVLHDEQRSAGEPFRMWYNADVVDDPADGEYFGVTAYLESADGARWPGPYERVSSLTADGRVRFGANVLDEGPAHRPASERFKMLYFDAGKEAGPRVAFSADGNKWTLYQDGKPVVPTSNSDDIWTAGYDRARQRYFLFGKTFVPFTWTNAEGEKISATIRRYHVSHSPDFKTWSEPRIVFSPDERDAGITQWYGPAGFLQRGDLILAFLRVLRDDLSAEGVAEEAILANTKGPAGLGASGLKTAGAGMGYTVLAWTRDGENWKRDRHQDKYLAPDPRVPAWDHAMAWVGSAVPVKDEVFLYYAGYKSGHKYRHSVERQIGLVKTQRDRFVAWESGEKPGKIISTPLLLAADRLLLNVSAAEGKVQVQVTEPDGTLIPDFRFEDCRPVTSDSLAAELAWKRPLSDLRGRTVRWEISIQNARLFAWELR